jgi:hypothetical protein
VTGVHHLQASQLLGVGLYGVGQPEQVSTPLSARQGRPAGKSGLCSCDGAIDIRLAGFCDVRQFACIVRIQRCERATIEGIHEIAADEQSSLEPYRSRRDHGCYAALTFHNNVNG